MNVLQKQTAREVIEMNHESHAETIEARSRESIAPVSGEDGQDLRGQRALSPVGGTGQSDGNLVMEKSLSAAMQRKVAPFIGLILLPSGSTAGRWAAP